MGPLATALVFTLGFFGLLFFLGRYEESRWHREHPAK